MSCNRHGIELDEHLKLRAHAFWKRGNSIPRHLEKEMEDAGLDATLEYQRWCHPETNTIKETI